MTLLKRRLKGMLVKAIMDPANSRFYKSAEELGAEESDKKKKKGKKDKDKKDGSWGIHGRY